MHKTPEPVAAFYVSGPAPLKFDELYSPRDNNQPVLIKKEEKSYWRTRDRIEYALYEDRQHKVLVVTCYNVEAKEALRTIFVCLETLFFEVESKARASRDALTKKKDKKLAEDADLRKVRTTPSLAWERGSDVGRPR